MLKNRNLLIRRINAAYPELQARPRQLTVQLMEARRETKEAAKNAEEVIKAKKEKRQPIIIPNFSCHHLRHTFCTRFCEKETNVKVTQAVMGHANIETTMDIYAEVTDAKKKEAIENLFSIPHA